MRFHRGVMSLGRRVGQFQAAGTAKTQILGDSGPPRPPFWSNPKMDQNFCLGTPKLTNTDRFGAVESTKMGRLGGPDLTKIGGLGARKMAKIRVAAVPAAGNWLTRHCTKPLC